MKIIAAISSHFPESLIRTRFTEYVIRFTRLASRYEEDALGSTKFGYPSSSFGESSEGHRQLGSGIVFGDDALGAKELTANASRIDGWRRTVSYQYLLTVCTTKTTPLFSLNDTDRRHPRISRKYAQRRPSKALTYCTNFTVYGFPKMYPT